MTVAEMLRDMTAADAARRTYRIAAERHAERALRAQDQGRRREARWRAHLALLLQDEAQR